MRALSLCTLVVFLFMLAAHMSGLKTSHALETKIVVKNDPIFSGPDSRQVQKLNQLSEIQSSKELEYKPAPEKTVEQKASVASTDIFSNRTNLFDHRSLSSQGEHLLKMYAQEFSPVKEFDQITIEGIIQTKQLPESGPAATALIETLEKIQKNPKLKNENYTNIFFDIYEELAFNPNFHSGYYEMRDALSRMNYKQDEIEEFEEGIFQKEVIKY